MSIISGDRTHPGPISSRSPPYARFRCIWVHCILLFLCACTASISDDIGPVELASRLPSNWQVGTHAEDGIAVVVAMPVPTQAVAGGEVLTVFVEGDGNAWSSRSRPSPDPTPKNPLALKLALLGDGNARIAYMARPCQFEARAWPGCTPNLWTHERYGPESLAAMSGALDVIKGEGEQVLIVGYSGGGVMAALLAATRDDVVGFITVAANLDTQAWTELHRVSPLEGSLVPLAYGECLAKIPQVHLVGGRDDIVPPRITDSYLRKVAISGQMHRITQAEFDHHCCWVREWPTLHARAMGQLRRQIGAGGSEAE